MTPKFLRTAITATLLLLPGSMFAQTQSFSYLFDINLGMAKIGEMRVSADIAGTNYSTVGSLKSTGLAGAIYDVSYESRAQGTFDHPWHFVPVRYSSVSVENDESTTTAITYSGNRVSNVSMTPPKDGTSTGQTDTIDPMTLIYFLVRPVPAENVCGGTFNLFDGSTSMTVSYTNPRRFNDGRIECSVAYSGKNSGVALSSVTFTPGDDGMMYISRFNASTNAGTLTARRR